MTIFILSVSISSINATNTNITSDDNLGETIANTPNGGTIRLNNGTYKNNVTNIVIDKNITIIGKNSKNTIINAQRIGRIFEVTSGNTLTLINITLTNGEFIRGGAILNVGQLTMTDCQLINNIGNNNGGAIRNEGSININNCNISDNYGNNAGSIYNLRNASAIINNSTFTNNQATNHGGAIRNDEGNLIIDNCNFINNRAIYGSCIRSLGNLTIRNSNFKNHINSAILHEGTKLDILNSNFTENILAIDIRQINTTIKGCNVINNNQGISIINSLSNNIVINYNRIFNNTNYNLNNHESNVDANYNWWGSNTISGVIGANLNNYYVVSANAIKNKDVLGGNWTINYNLYLNGTNNIFGVEFLPDFIFNLIDSSHNTIYSQSAKDSGIFSIPITKIINETHYILVDNELISLGTLTSEKIKTDIDMNISGNKKINETLIISGNIKDQFGENLNNKTIYLIVNGKIVATGHTNTHGNIVFNYTLLNNGKYNFQLRFDGEENYTDSSNSQNFDIAKTKTTIHIFNIKETKIGEKIVFKALLSDREGNPLNNKLVNFYINGEKVGSAITNREGLVTYEYIPQKAGEFKIEAKFNEDIDYSSSQTQSNFKVSKNNKPDPQPTPTPSPTPNPHPGPNSEPENQANASMKSTGIPIIAIILILISSLGVIVRRK